MAMSKSDFLSELARIEQGHLDAVYLLRGGDLYLEDEAINTICQAFGKQESERPEKLIYYGGVDSDLEFIDNLFSMGFFARRRIIIYKNIGNLEPNLRARLFNFIENPGQDTVLIMTADGESHSSLIEQLRKESRKVKMISTWTPKSSRFDEFIRRHLQKSQYSIRPEALKLLIELTDDALSHTIGELEKLLIYIGERKIIEEDDVRLIVGGDKNYDMINFLEAVAHRDITKAIKIGLALIQADASIPYFTTQLYDLFSGIWDYEGHGQKEKFWKKSNCYELGIKNYKQADFGAIFTCIRNVDLQSKSLNLNKEDLLIQLLYEIIS